MRDLVDAILAPIERALANPLPWVCRTDAQARFLAETARIALWRKPNQVGGSRTSAELAVRWARGEVRPAPVHVLVVSATHTQIIPLMEHIRGFLCQEDHDDDLDDIYTLGRGFVGKPPRVVYRNGSVISFSSYDAGPGAFMGARVDLLILDEPPPRDIYGEAIPRVFARRGVIRISMTPTPDAPDLTYLRTLVEEGKVTEHHTTMSVDALTPRQWATPEIPEVLEQIVDGVVVETLDGPAEITTWPRPWRSDIEIRSYAASLDEVEAGMRLEGDWRPLVTDRWLTNYRPSMHILPTAPDPSDLVRRGWRLWLGVDHGVHGGGKQRAALVAVTNERTARPKAIVLGEAARPDEITTPADDAEDILSMLVTLFGTGDVASVDARQRAWVMLHGAVGDVPLDSAAGPKTNDILMREIARAAGVRRVSELAPGPTRLMRPRKTDKGASKGSMSRGVRALNMMLGHVSDGTPDLQIVHTCEGFLAFCEEFDGNTRHVTKDAGDAVRYPIERATVRPSTVQ